MKNRLMILGSGTCDLVPEKAAASVLIEKDGTRPVYDFGRSISVRLTEAGFNKTTSAISSYHICTLTTLLIYIHIYMPPRGHR